MNYIHALSYWLMVLENALFTGFLTNIRKTENPKSNYSWGKNWGKSYLLFTWAMCRMKHGGDLMAYADYAFYTDVYHGDVLTAANAAKWLDRASDAVDALTFRRTVYSFPVAMGDAVKVRKAVCAIADALCLIDDQVKAMQATKDAAGNYRGAVASISSGRESVHYVQAADGSIYGRAAADPEAKARLLSQIAGQYLADVPGANGINLLYAGA